MDIKSCKRCNKMFQYVVGKQVCPACLKQEDEIFLVVKQYLEDNPGASPKEVTEATGTHIRMIQMFLREGRLQVSKDSPLAMSCEQCGAKIPRGKLCNDCRTKLEGQMIGLKDAFKKPVAEEQKGARMRSTNLR